MPKGSSKRRKPDSSQAAHRILETIIEKTEREAPPDETEALIEITPEMRAAAAAFGRIGGKIGGPARAAKLSPTKRSEIAKAAAAARWKNRRVR